MADEPRPLPPEPLITVNRTFLTDDQAMTLRMSLGQFMMFLSEPEMSEGEDKTQQQIRLGYLARAKEIIGLMQS